MVFSSVLDKKMRKSWLELWKANECGIDSKTLTSV